MHWSVVCFLLQLVRCPRLVVRVRHSDGNTSGRAISRYANCQQKIIRNILMSDSLFQYSLGHIQFERTPLPPEFCTQCSNALQCRTSRSNPAPRGLINSARSAFQASPAGREHPTSSPAPRDSTLTLPTATVVGFWDPPRQRCPAPRLQGSSVPFPLKSVICLYKTLAWRLRAQPLASPPKSRCEF